MAGPTDTRDAARKRAQNHFTASEQRDNLVKQEIEKERHASDAKTAKLRALRLAKEAADKVEADAAAVQRAEDIRSGKIKPKAVKTAVKKVKAKA